MHPALMLKLSEALRNNDSQEYSDILDLHQFNQESFVSDCNLTIFHEIANSKINEKYLIPFLDKTAQAIISKLSHHSLLHLINAQVQIEDMFSALHLSILRGKANLARRLIELGANPSQKTGKGRNGLHLCAETGLLSLFLFIRDEYGLALDLQDHKGLGPIHLAISERREDMAMLILSLCKGLDINVKLALEMAVQTGSYKITRNLLIHRRQESLDIRNLAKSEDKDISKLLVFVSQEHPRAGQKNCFYFFLMIFGFLTKYSSIGYFIVFFGERSMLTDFVNVARLLTLMVIVVLAVVINRVNPGFEVLNEKVSLMELYSKYIPEYVCPYCELKKHKSTKHCYSCQKCVRDYDHHCKWLNNCIGRSNLNLFIALLIFCIINVMADAAFYCLASFDFYEINWILLLDVPRLGLAYQYLEAYTIVVDLAVILIVVPVAYKLAKRRRKIKEVSKKLPKEPLLSHPDHIKGFRDLENEATSDTTSMFLKNTLDSNSESASSSTFLSQFFSNRSQ